MQLARIEDVPMEDLQENHRDGKFERRRLLEGPEGAPDNFIFEMVRTYGDFFSPRHRHNFDQFRVQLEGSFDFDRDGVMRPGTIAYFPEGVYYGQQSSSEDSLTVVLQFGGAGGNGYISANQAIASVVALKKSGAFSKGIYTRRLPDGGKRNQDGFEAVWEQVNQRKLEYPPPRYGKPIFIEPANFAWIPVAEKLARKRLGVFTECEARVDLYRIEPGGTLPLEARSIYFVMEGSGGAGAQGWARHSTIFPAQGETGVLAAEAPSEVLRLGLPNLAALPTAAPAVGE